MSKKNAAQERRELMRLTLLLDLYKRRARETPFEFIHAKMRNFMGEPVTEDEIEAEMHFLIDSGYVVMRHHELGATKQFRLHANGVLLVEREYAHHLDE